MVRFEIIIDSVDFYVQGSKGPFKEGEVERMIAHVRKALD